MNDLSSLDHQIEMPLTKRADRQHVPDSVVYAQSSSTAALTLAISVSGLEDQDIYKPLGIDAGQWSRIRSHKNNFPTDKIKEFSEIVGNTIYLQWLNYQCGMETRPMLNTVEMQLEAAKARINELEHDKELMARLLQR